MASTLATISSNKIDQTFDRLRGERRKALVCYVTAGHPDPASSVELLRGLEGAGADVIEVGVPFSDPIADGPVIQASSQQALAHGVTLERTLEIVSEAALNIPVVLFTYLNPIIAAGEHVLERARDAGVDGVLITDLPVGADREREAWLGASELAFVRLVAPTTPLERMREIAHNGSGFVYLISRLGVTGASASLAPDLPETAARLRKATDLPICVGFGVSEAAHARAAAAVADGVVAGSAIVKAAGRELSAAVELASTLRHALDS
ncbi:MAG TPA: tryptophan synthase subunit alpha [Gemmatimonadaceae bacterium]|nr:tryptophan synthase subunit alpha [Gemmatimonadaceae bacterium]